MSRDHENGILFYLLGYFWQLQAQEVQNLIIGGDEIKQAHTYTMLSIVSRDHENSIIFILLGYLWQLGAPKGQNVNIGGDEIKQAHTYTIL